MSLCVVIPVYNEADVLPLTVPAILALDGVDEVVWVDDGSTDSSRDVLASLTADSTTSTILELPSNQGRAAARNAGVSSTGGETVVFLDSDVLPRADTAVQLANGVAEGIVATVAALRPQLGDRSDPYAHYLRAYPRGPHPAAAGPISWRYFVTAACAVRRSAFEHAGGFDERLDYGEDLALACRLATAHPHGLALAPTTAQLHGVGDLAEALRHVREFGRSLRLIESDCPAVHSLVGMPSWARAAAPWIPSAPAVHRVVGRLPRRMVPRAVRYLLGHALLAAYARA